MSEPDRYFELDANWDAAYALRFAEPSRHALAQVRDILANLPIRPYRGIGPLEDRVEKAAFRGPLDALLPVLSELLRTDHATNVAELNDICNFEVIVTDSPLQPDAIHLVTRLSSKGSHSGSVLYGLRVQRFGESDFALWSDY